ncbi:aldehyde dehydrogenase family protein [Arthrobacter sp. B6]|uniref:aldehyde dehydrogenase family protein n=1 Tax=Arthrobacter sp. B6 TaxID=1570137 RepID=UPI000830729A|nr:aldehyde dehydrogenase family protein [Arthrobacter sp. B6]
MTYTAFPVPQVTSPLTPQLLIGGRLVDGDRPSMAILNPADETVFALSASASPEQLSAAIDAAKTAFPGWRDTPVDERRAAVRRIGELISEHQEELATLLTSEQGKRITEARGEIGRAALWFSEMATLDVPWDVVVEEDDERVVRIRRVPMGVVAALSPWNFPVTLAMWKVAPALLTGNTVVLKPSPYTPVTNLRIAELINGVVPAGVFNVVAGDHDLGPLLTSDPRIDRIVFTGSTSTGSAVMRSAAATLASVTLELGGNDAAIVMPDVDLDTVAGQVFWTSFTNNAQYCLASKRVYIHESIYDEFAARVVAYARSIRVGNGLDPEVDLGPVANHDQYTRVRAIIDDVEKSGLTFLLRGEIPEGKGFYIHPSIIDNPPDDAPVVAEESFGPIVPFLKFSDVNEVIERVNASPYGLGGSVWCADPELAEGIARRIDSGIVWINEVQRLSARFPLGGHKMSGVGSENGIDGVLQYTNVQVLSAHRQGMAPS